MREKNLAVLSKAPLFEQIDDKDLQGMLDCLQPQICKYRKNDIIATAGEPLSSVGVMLEGEATVSKENAAGDRLVIKILQPGDMFGEMAVFSKNSAWPATVQAREDCKVFFLGKSKIISPCSKVCQWHQILIQNMLRIITESALTLNRKVEYLSIKSMRGKLCAYFLERYKTTGKTTFTMPLNRNELADFLNVSRPSMSREMCRMREEGLIDFHLNAVRIKDPEALKNQENL